MIEIERICLIACCRYQAARNVALDMIRLVISKVPSILLQEKFFYVCFELLDTVDASLEDEFPNVYKQRENGVIFLCFRCAIGYKHIQIKMHGENLFARFTVEFRCKD